MADHNIGAGGQAKFLVTDPDDRARAARALGALQDEAVRAESALAAHVLHELKACGCGEKSSPAGGRRVTFCQAGLDLYGSAVKARGVADMARQVLESMGVPSLPGKQFQVTE